MKAKDVRLYAKNFYNLPRVEVRNQNEGCVFVIHSGKHRLLTKSQAIAFANKLCERFNDGQEGK